MTDAELTAQAVSDLESKQKRNLLWSKIASVLVAVTIIIRGAVWLASSTHPMECDDSKVQSAVTDLIAESFTKAKLTISLTSLTDIKTVSRDDKLARCTAHVAMSDNSAGTLKYHLDPKQIELDGME
jgi:hypothetical protein